ncbi:hypothetical protein B566_EDAN000762 [Ephemera danica]|nr:hypothetical protein B566_EDAN000762 [Ephemera danica]
MAAAAETSKESLKQTEDTSGAFKRQGSIRKVLPSVPGASDPAKLIDRPGGVSGGSEIRNTWFGVMFVRQGMYQGAVFRFTLHIPENFPDSGCPTLDFQTPVFHPLVCPATGLLDVSRAFPDWNKNSNHIWQVVEFARKTFMKIDTQHPINIEAAQMYENDLDKFAERAEECVHSSQQHLYDLPPTDDPHYLSFEPYNSAVHDKVKQNMLNLSVSTAVSFVF